MEQSKLFIVSQLARQDLINELDLSEEEINKISDETMQKIAYLMGEFYTENNYWADLREAYNQITNDNQ